MREEARLLLPESAVQACEALMQAMVSKYPEPRWPKIPAEEHLAALHRHGAAFERGAVDADSGESHAIHVAVRALMLVAVELEHGRRPGDPLEAAQAAVRRAIAAVEAVGGGAAVRGQVDALRDVEHFLARRIVGRALGAPRSLDCTA